MRPIWAGNFSLQEYIQSLMKLVHWFFTVDHYPYVRWLSVHAVVNDDGGAVGLTECPAALQRWMFSGPVMARVIIDFERVDRAVCSGQECRIYSRKM